MTDREERRLERRASDLEAELRRRETPSQAQARMATGRSANAYDGTESATERQVASVRSSSERQATSAQGVDFDDLSEREQKRQRIREAFARSGGAS